MQDIYLGRGIPLIRPWMNPARLRIYPVGFAGDHRRGFGRTAAMSDASCDERSLADFPK